MPSFPRQYQEKKWIVFHWQMNELMSEGIGSFDTLQECQQFVFQEIEQTHKDIGEDTLTVDQYLSGKYSENMIFVIPFEDTNMIKVYLANGSNGPDVIFGWIAYLRGQTPDDID